MKNEQFSRTPAAWALVLILLAMGSGRAEAASIYTATVGGDVQGFVGESVVNSPVPVSVSGAGSDSGTALGNASASRGSVAAFAQKVESAGGNGQRGITSFASFQIDDLLFSLVSGDPFSSGQSFSTSLNYDLDGRFDMAGRDTGAHLEVLLRVGSGEVFQPGGFVVTQSSDPSGWEFQRSGILSSLAGTTMAGTTPTFTADVALSLTSPSFTLTAGADGTIVSPSIFLQLQTGVSGPGFGGNPINLSTDFEFGFAPNGLVFNLPDGITVNSPDGMIVNNQWVGGPAAIPTPATAAIGLTAFAILALRRPRRDAQVAEQN